MAGSRWTPLDVGYFHNPKARAAGKNGRALHLASCCWAADNMTDGKVLPTDVSLLCAEAEVPKSTVAILVREGLWEVRTDGPGWMIHDFLVHNKSRDAIEERRRTWADKKAGQRAVSPGDSKGESHESPATRQTDRQTDRQRRVQVCTDDDSVDTGQRSSSSAELIIQTAAKAIALADRENPRQGFINGISANLRKEQLSVALECIEQGMTLHDAAIRLGADSWYVQQVIEGNAA